MEETVLTDKPLLWRWLPWPHSHEADLPFRKFQSNFRVSGLALERGDRLNILALYSSHPGQGHCRAFIRACKGRYKEIAVWEYGNLLLAAALQRWGFISVEEWWVHPPSGRRELVRGWKWTQKINSSPDFSLA